jgi:gamma-glutamyltranspeptidase/glutathione hydrolase
MSIVLLQPVRGGHVNPRSRFIDLFPWMAVVLVIMLSQCSGNYKSPKGPSSSALEGRRFMVAADSPFASEAGAEILRKGGNAVDAAVATAFALSVVRPSSAGLGGGGFLILKEPGKEAVVLDFREVAPAGAKAACYLDEKGDAIPEKTVFGPWAVAVPGTVAGLARVLKEHGTMELPQVLRPAIRLAEAGFPIDAFLHSEMKDLVETYRRHPSFLSEYPETYRIYLTNGIPYEAGEILRQEDLARTLKRIGELGAGDFYEGRIARAIITEIQKHGGPMREEDLRRYAPKLRRPLLGKYRGLDVITMPPPSSGGAVVLQVLGVFDTMDIRGRFGPTPGIEYYHFLAECLKNGFADRARLLGDSDVFPEVLPDIERMLSPGERVRILKSIIPERTRATEEYGIGSPNEDHGTCHFCVVDGHGSAVACTFTINLGFGSLVAVPGTGIVLNNEMDDFSVKLWQQNAFKLVTGDRDLVRPGAKPLSSMTPTIFARDGRPVLVIGASGGPRIISSTLQVAIDILDFGMKPGAAVSALRIHHQWKPDVLRVEAALAPETVEALRAKNHRVEPFPGSPGHVQVIWLDGAAIYGASDPRKGGRPAGE